MNPSPSTAASDAADPLATIGLALSGGGFRAASFSLGCLAYLNECRVDPVDGQPQTLLDRVRFVASASGGSLPNMLYATYRYSGQSFGACYKALREFMASDTLFRHAFRMLESDAPWKNTQGKQRNLVNALSLAYQELFDNALIVSPNQSATMGLFSKTAPTLPRICVNSTDFQNGLTFRFQHTDGKALLGNFGLSLDPNQPEVANKLRLGDIMAASSCFPSGLEPIMFPRDFAHGSAGQSAALTVQALSDALICNDPVQKARKIRGDAPVATARLTTQEQLDSYNTEQDSPATSSGTGIQFGLMDGGIDDNQGLGSLMLADSRKEDGERFGTLIACDVSSPYMTPFKLPQAQNSFLRDRSLRFWGWTLAVLGVGLLGWGIWGGWPTGGTVLATLGTLILLADAGINLAIWRGLRSLAEAGTWGWVATQYVGYFFTIPLSSLFQMLDARLQSTVILASDVYMKQIRRMHYERFYNDTIYKNRRVACMLHTLATYTESTNSDNKDAACTAKYDLRPSKVMKELATEAMNMDTTLWFSPDEMDKNLRDKLIATGQFSLCYNLLLYLCRLESVAPLTPAFLALQKKMLADWKQFKQTPMWLVEKLG